MMADTASLVARVKTDGADLAAKQLNNVAVAADNADNAVKKLPPDVNNMDKALTAAAKGGMSTFRNGAQQVGFQVQDMVVQLQSGTSAFVAIGQQGSQLAGAFGPGGAVLGAVIALGSAIGGVLYKSLGDASVGAKELEDATKSLQGVLKAGSTGALELTDELLKLAEQSNAAALSKLAASIADAGTQIKAAGQSAADATTQFDSLLSGSVGGAAVALNRMTEAGQTTADVLKNISSFSDAAGSSAIALRSVVDGLSSTLGVTKEEALGLVSQLDAVQKSKSPEAVQSLANSTANLQAQYGTTNPKLNEFNNIMQDAVVQMMNGKSAAEALQGAYNNLAATIDRLKAKQVAAGDAFVAAIEIQSKRGKELINAQTKQQIDAINQREGLSEEQRAAALAAAKKAGDLDLKEFDEREKQKDARANAAGERRAAAQSRRDETAAARQKKQAEDFLSQVDRTSGDEIARIDTNEQQKLDKLAAFRNQRLISEAQFEQARTSIQLTAEDARQQELDKREQERAKKQGQHDQFIANIQAENATELELIDAQTAAKEAKAQEFRDRGIINEEEYQASIEAIQSGAEKKKSKVYENALSDTTNNLKAALGENTALYKAAAITQTIIETYKGAQAAFSALAPIPIVGPILGAAAAAAAIAGGLARVGQIRSAREQGGNLAAGQASTIAERGKPEVIMPAGASRVRTAAQMRQIMGDNGGGKSGGDSVVIVNQTSGRIDTAKTERDDEGRLRVIIRELVSGDMLDSNSQISQSRRATSGQPGFK